jgi:hypothetical protein
MGISRVPRAHANTLVKANETKHQRRLIAKAESGRLKVNGPPYCKMHTRRAYKPPEPRQRPTQHREITQFDRQRRLEEVAGIPVKSPEIRGNNADLRNVC